MPFAFQTSWAFDSAEAVQRCVRRPTPKCDAQGGLTPGIGASVSASLVPEALQPRYGGVGIGIGVFLTLRPALHEMAQ